MLARLACVLRHHGHHWPDRVNNPTELRCTSCGAVPRWRRRLFA